MPAFLTLFDFKSQHPQSKHICISKRRNALWHVLSKTDIPPDVWESAEGETDLF